MGEGVSPSLPWRGVPGVDLRSLVVSVPCTRELVCSSYFPRNGDSKHLVSGRQVGIPKSWVTDLESLDLMGSDKHDTVLDVIHTLHKLGLSGVVTSGDWDSEVITTTDSDGERTKEDESIGVADSCSGWIIDLGVSSGLSGVRASDDDVSAGYAMPAVAVANIGPIACSDAVKTTDIDGYGTAVSNIGPNADSGLFNSDLLDSAPLSSVPGRSDNGIHPEVSFLGLDDGDFPPIRLLPDSGKGFLGKGNGASQPLRFGASFRSNSSDQILICNASATKTAWRDGVQPDYGVAVPNTSDAMSSGSMGSGCAIQARSNVGGHALPQKLISFPVGSVPANDAFFPEGPGALLAHTAQVTVPETMDCVDSSGVVGPDYCLDFYQPAGKPGHGVDEVCKHLLVYYQCPTWSDKGDLFGAKFQ